jgi:hypothetical protein
LVYSNKKREEREKIKKLTTPLTLTFPARGEERKEELKEFL